MHHWVNGVRRYTGVCLRTEPGADIAPIPLGGISGPASFEMEAGVTGHAAC
jgi:hypothetical protein